ncbi:UDP-N-acetylglucosamine transporter UGNT1-like isoform X3 [Primulina tabacum]|uniref:UDP-N-acetylglucosamine transporter UGNT1-like isoform X3 n=1 Tax=Primulina tabacum TaxID=48773 RepID=UPI003F59F2FE
MATSAKSSSILPLAAGDSPVRAEEKLFKGSAMTKRGAQAAISYMTCAVLLVMFNKAALSSYGFPCANVITLCQMISSCCFLYALRRLKIISFFSNESVSISDSSKPLVPMKTLFDTSPLALTYLLYMLATMESVRGVNVPMYTTLRRTTVVFTMIVEYILVKQKYTIHIHGSGLNSFGLMWCNGILCGPVLLVWTLFRGDLEMTMNFPNLFSPGFLAVLFLSCILAFFLNYSIFLNTTLNSALTQTICGNLKDLFTISLGWVVFGGLPFDLLNVIGQLLGFIGSGLYAYYKLIGK